MKHLVNPQYIPLPLPPVSEEEMDRWFRDITDWLKEFSSKYNDLICATQNIIGSPSIFTVTNTSDCPTDLYITVNMKINEDSNWVPIDITKSVWAIRIDLTLNKLTVLYCAAGTTPIVWTTLETLYPTDGGFPPPGTCMLGAGALPTGYLLCNGALLLVASYPRLFASIGYTYGGAGANFNVPNLAAYGGVNWIIKY